MTSLQELTKLYIEDHKIRYPSLPDYARVSPKYTDKTANGLTKCIIDWCLLTGNFAERTSNEGRVIDGRKTYKDAIGQTKTIGTIKRIPSSGTKGTSDIKAIIGGKMVAVEVKIGKDRQSEVQKEYQMKVEQAGGLYWIVTNFEDFMFKYRFEFGINDPLRI